LSLQELRTEIERKAQEEATGILEKAKKEAQRIITESNVKAAKLREERTEALTVELDAQQRTELAIARMDQKGELLQLQSQWVNRVFEEVGKRIAKMAENNGQDYHEVLTKLILEGILKLNGNKFIVEANSRDRKTIEQSLRTIEEKAGKIKKSKVVLQTGTQQVGSVGGVIISAEDGAQYFNNTLEARLSAATRNLGGEVYKMLFGAGETNE
jgi:vacuolar-type H+-ATPase subunit E/Vma4